MALARSLWGDRALDELTREPAANLMTRKRSVAKNMSQSLEAVWNALETSWRESCLFSEAWKRLEAALNHSEGVCQSLELIKIMILCNTVFEHQVLNLYASNMI